MKLNPCQILSQKTPKSQIELAVGLMHEYVDEQKK
jgi:hypothetical protein